MRFKGISLATFFKVLLIACVCLLFGAHAHLPDGLTENAMAAARAARFKPATKDGRPVSTWTTLEYNYEVY